MSPKIDGTGANADIDDGRPLSEENAALLKKLADMCLHAMPGIGDQKIAELENVLRFVAQTMKFRQRLGLATAVAALERVPTRVVDIFLNDVYAVAQPIIENLNDIEEGVLVRLANTHEENYLFSIAKRRTVPFRLTDIIVEKGQNPSVFTVARNQGAQFSPQGFTRLVGRARSEITLQNILSSRPDVPAEVMKQLQVLVAARGARPAVVPAAPRLGGLAGERQGTGALDELRAKLQKVVEVHK